MSGPGLETAAPIMEALVLNCAGLNLGLLLNNIWTWVAVMTAAVGFWRIRTVKPDMGPIQPDTDLKRPNSHQNSPVQDNPVRITEERTAPEPSRAPSTSTRLDESPLERVTKGNKYLKEYYNYNYTYTDGGYEVHAELVGKERKNVGGWEGGDWAVVEEWRIRSPAAEGMGWYSYQDLRVLDGSVVRLWDHAGGCCRRRRLPSLVGVTRFLGDCNGVLV